MGQGPLPIRPLNCDSCACKLQINYVYTFWCLQGGQLLKLKCCTLREHLSLALNKGLGKVGWTHCQCGACGVVKPVRLNHGDLVYLFCEYLFSFLFTLLWRVWSEFNIGQTLLCKDDVRCDCVCNVAAWTTCLFTSKVKWFNALCAYYQHCVLGVAVPYIFSCQPFTSHF